MITTRPFLLLIFACSVCSVSASPRSDLSSPSQKIRDAAAKILLTSYTPPARTNWESIVAQTRIGDSKTNVLEHLRRFGADLTYEFGFGTGATCVDSYRLDDLWMLECHFLCLSNTLLKRMLTVSVRCVPVDPPPKFTGVWTTYFVNGQRCHEIRYKDGKYNGKFISFRPDGSKSYIQHYGANHIDGADTGYFPSGRIMYRGVYRAGVQIGTWTWYNEDGTIRSTKTYSNSKPNLNHRDHDPSS